MELRHLRYFVAVAEEEHFARAARRLHISAPPLSQQIRELEKELGVALFQRVGRGVRLTDAGRILHEEAAAVLAQVDRAVHRTRGAALGNYGSLTLAFAETASMAMIPLVATRFRARHPEVALELVPMPIHLHADAVRARQITAALTYKVDERQESDLSAELFYSAPLGIAMARVHPLAAYKTIRAAMLHEQPIVWIRRNDNLQFYDYLSAKFAELGVRLRVTVATASMETRLGLAASGIAVTFAAVRKDPAFPENVVVRPLADIQVDLRCLLLWRPESDASPLVTSLREILRVVFRSPRSKRTE